MELSNLNPQGGGGGGGMGEVGKILYIVVVDEVEKKDKGKESFRYTRPVLQSTLQLMGCKARHAFKVSSLLFLFTYSILLFGFVSFVSFRLIIMKTVVLPSFYVSYLDDLRFTCLCILYG